LHTKTYLPHLPFAALRGELSEAAFG